ncbi:CDC42 small effector protein homolog isoform X1 [Drosophila grimshawi]|nr:CDC42 small effector protein homolog isoform X1 [Drosophila grimshawi]XP_032595715.1 CDC42 small effector protein homolog isoform X1 [Drosophila grimshawi]XP_032595717.1 CDC42 small effector protein homolog isoform X1 [Drosophila grimshawi]
MLHFIGQQLTIHNLFLFIDSAELCKNKQKENRKSDIHKQTDACISTRNNDFNLAGSSSSISNNHYKTERQPSSSSGKLAQKMASTGEIWLQWFSCCFQQQQQRSPTRRPHHQRLRIDRSMIGNPTNFVHTGHIGSADVELSANRLNAISTQMQSKGGYETNSIHSLHAC